MEPEAVVLSTDEEILSSIGEGNETTTETEEPNEATTEATTEESQASDSGQDTDTSTTTKLEDQQTRGPQDLIGRDGKVIAKGGTERRLYEKSERFRQEAERSSAKVAELETQLNAINAAGNLGTQYDLTPDELTTGAQMMKSFKEDPVNTVKYLLTQAQALGHNIDGIGAGSDMASIKQMLTEALKPVTEAQKSASDTQAAQDAATKSYNDFVSTYPDAELHGNALARLLADDPQLTPEVAYYKLKNFYLEQKLDWSKPLEQLQQEAEAASSKPLDVNTQTTIPSGGNIPNQNVTDTAQVADVGTSYDDIIRESLKDAGMNYN